MENINLKVSWTKYDVVKLIEIIANGDLANTNLSELNASVVKKILCTENIEEIPRQWFEIEEKFETERGQVALVFAILSSMNVTSLIIQNSNIKKGIGSISFQSNNKESSNLRSAMVVAGSTEAINRRAKEVPFDFVSLLAREDIGITVKELIVYKLKIIGLYGVDNPQLLSSIIKEWRIHLLFGVSFSDLTRWLDGKHLNLKRRTQSKPKTKSDGTALLANRFICEDPTTINLSEAIKHVLDGKWALAPFQRPESWSWTQQEMLLDSLKQGIPIGVMYLWGYDKSKKIPFRNIPGIITNKNKIESLILDGQQRLSFLSWLALKAKDKNFPYGPGTIYFNALENSFSKTESHENLGLGIIRVHMLFSSGYKDKLDKALNNSLANKKLTIPEFTYINDNIQGLYNAIYDRKIVIQQLNKDEGIPESFKLYERVNKAGTHLKGNDYVEAALFSVFPDLHNKIKSAVEELIKDPEGKRKPTFNNLFNRSLFIRCILDELYGTPNPEDRKSYPLANLMEFGNPKYPKSGRLLPLTPSVIENTFKKVNDAFCHYREILTDDLFIYDGSGISGTFSIAANSLLRNQGRKMSIQKKGKFMRWFILFHIQNNPYLGSQDKKIKEDCDAARLEDPFDKLDELLASHSAGKEVKDLKFTKSIYGVVGGRAKKQGNCLGLF